MSKKIKNQIIKNIENKINNIQFSKDPNLEKYNICVILDFLRSLHIFEIKSLQELLNMLNNTSI